MRLPLVLLLGASGCAQLAGIDETSSAMPSSSSLSVEQLSISTMVTRTPFDLAGLTATYLIPDAAGPGGFRRVEATASGNTWTADLDGTIAPVMFELPILGDPMDRTELQIYDFPIADLKTAVSYTGRPDAEMAPAPATLTVGITLDTAYVDGEQFTLHTMGVWNTRGLAVPVAGSGTVGPESFDYTMMNSLTGRPHEKITTADLVYAVRTSGGLVTGYAEAMPFDQTGMDTLSLTMTPVAQDQPLTLNVMPQSAATRIAAARPSVGTPTFDWQVRIGPATDIGFGSGQRLHAGSLAVDSTQVVTSYGNPFGSRPWKPMLSYNASAARTYTAPTGPTVTLIAAMTELSTAMPEQMLDFKAGFPERISINKMSLSTDNVMIPFPVAPVEVEIETDRTTVSIYQATLLELVPNMENTAFTLRPIVHAAGSSPRFLLPPELFQAGRFYTIRVSTLVGGFPNANDGDFTQIALPISMAFVDSGVFGVM